jgi:hypothetical protein
MLELSKDLSSGMGPPRRLGRASLSAGYSQSPFVLDDPLDGLAFVHFQSLGQRSRANQIELLLPIGPLDHLEFG